MKGASRWRGSKCFDPNELGLTIEANKSPSETHLDARGRLAYFSIPSVNIFILVEIPQSDLECFP